MIRRLHLTNFRRHADSEIVVDSSQQVVAITGNNGAGKTALLEAIVFCLYGESRHGLRRVESLVRRGGELEGMQVELEFSRDGVDYLVQRRRDNRAVSAALYTNGVAVVSGHRAVTAEITRIFGMDASGFKMAVVAQQKELDAILRLGGSARSRAVGRLLRLDAVTRAKDDARSRWKDTLIAARAVPEDNEIGALEQQSLTLEAALAAARAAEAACRAEVSALENELADSRDVAEVYFQTKARQQSLQEHLERVRTQRHHLSSERDTITVVELDDLNIDVDALNVRRHQLDLDIAASEERQRTIQQRRVIVEELAQTKRRVAELDDSQLDVIALEAERITIGERLRELDQDELAHTRERERLRERHSELRTLAKQQQDRLDAWAALGGECDRCNQPIPHEHAARQQHHLRQQLDGWKRELGDIVANGKQVTAAIDDLDRLRVALVERNTEIVAMLDDQARRDGERRELQRRLDAWGDLAVTDDTVDLDGLYHERGAVELELHAAETFHRLKAVRDQSIERRRQLDVDIAAIDVEIDHFIKQAASNNVDDDLRRRFEHHQAVERRWRDELDLLSALTEQTATLREQYATARQRLEQQQQLRHLRDRHLTDGAVAAAAVDMLDTLEKTMSVTIRPALESLVSDLLAAMSNHRFTRVKFATDYLPLVADDGTFRPLYELSGGEQDLVALAVRLALAQLVAERHGGGVGFLVLDEIFGSQDGERREAIMVALRELRRVFSQIWCISHVGGLEDAADLVIEVELDANGVAQLA